MSANSHGLPHSSLFGALGLAFSIEFARFPNSAATDRDAMSFGNFGQSQLSIDVNPIVSVPPDKNLAFLRSNRSEEHTSELQSLMRISYAVFCLKKKNKTKKNNTHTITH